MKTAAAIVLAFGAAAAQAQTQTQTGISIYGIVDAGFVHESGGAAGSVNKITSGVGSASRLGFRGVEGLGGGTSVLFTLENGHRLDTGEVDAAGAIFNRQAFVGINGKAGMLTLGRQYTPWHQALAQVGDPFATGYAGGSKNLFPDFGSNVRTSNTVMYTTPAIDGFIADLAYSAGEQIGGVAPTASTDDNELLLGAVLPAGPGNIVATLMRKDDRRALDQDARSFGLGYLYPLSKRTTLYTVYGMVDNENGAGYTVANNTEAGSGDRAFNLGVRHTF